MTEFDPDRKTYTIKAGEKLGGLIEAHRFPGETSGQLLNRLVLMAEEVEPSYSAIVNERKTLSYSFKPSKVAKAVIKKWWKDDLTTSMESILWITVNKPRIGNLQSADEAIVLLNEFAGQRITLSTARKLLAKRASRKEVDQWLARLDEVGKIRLIDVASDGKVSRGVIGDRRVGLIEIPKV